MFATHMHVGISIVQFGGAGSLFSSCRFQRWNSAGPQVPFSCTEASLCPLKNIFSTKVYI